MATVQKTSASSKTQGSAWNGAVPAAATAVVKRIERRKPQGKQARMQPLHSRKFFEFDSPYDERHYHHS